MIMMMIRRMNLMIVMMNMMMFTIKRAVDPKSHEARVPVVGKCWTWDGDSEVVDDDEYDKHDNDNDHDLNDNLPSIRQ